MSDLTHQPPRALSRRHFSIATALGALCTSSPMQAQIAQSQPIDPSSNEPLAVPERLKAHLSTLFDNKPLIPQGVTLNLPPLAENGNSVALGVTLKAPQNSDPFNRLYLFAEKNPLPDVARFEYSQATLNQELALRIRLADSQQIIAVAQTTTGALYAASASIIVTLAACIDIPL